MAQLFNNAPGGGIAVQAQKRALVIGQTKVSDQPVFWHSASDTWVHRDGADGDIPYDTTNGLWTLKPGRYLLEGCWAVTEVSGNTEFAEYAWFDEFGNRLQFNWSGSGVAYGGNSGIATSSDFQNSTWDGQSTASLLLDLRQTIRVGLRVFNFGGSVGADPDRSYQRIIELPSTDVWQIQSGSYKLQDDQARQDITSLQNSLNSLLTDNATDTELSNVVANLQNQIDNISTGATESFETILKNHLAWNVSYTYSNGLVATKVLSNGTDTITATYNYTNNDLTSIVLSGDVPTGISTTKTINYSNGQIIGILYS